MTLFIIIVHVVYENHIIRKTNEANQFSRSSLTSSTDKGIQILYSLTNMTLSSSSIDRGATKEERRKWSSELLARRQWRVYRLTRS